MPPTPLNPLKQPDECTLPCVTAICALMILLILFICTCLVLAWRITKRSEPFGRFEPEPETPPARRRSRWQRTYRHFGSSERLVFSPIHSESPELFASLISPDLMEEQAEAALAHEEEYDDVVARELYLALVSTSEDSDPSESDVLVCRAAGRASSRSQQCYSYFGSRERPVLSPDQVSPLTLGSPAFDRAGPSSCRTQ
jgi:hypothetical protein